MVVMLISNLTKLPYMVIVVYTKKRRTNLALRFISFYLIKTHVYQRSYQVLL